MWSFDAEDTGMISFIIPAHNEAVLIGRTLAAMHESARAAGEPYEIIVADDASLDGTGHIAEKHGARVVVVNFRHIAATRNAGARVATGDFLFFVDADTLVTARAVRAALGALRRGALGGGSAVRFDGPVPLYAAILERMVLPVLLPLLRVSHRLDNARWPWLPALRRRDLGGAFWGFQGGFSSLVRFLALHGLRGPAAHQGGREFEGKGRLEQTR